MSSSRTEGQPAANTAGTVSTQLQLQDLLSSYLFSTFEAYFIFEENVFLKQGSYPQNRLQTGVICLTLCDRKGQTIFKKV